MKLKLGQKIELYGISYEVDGTKGCYYLADEDGINDRVFEALNLDRYEFQNEILGYRDDPSTECFPECKTLKDLGVFVEAIKNYGKEDEFVLPEKWAIRTENKEITDYCDKYGENPPYAIVAANIAHFPCFKKGYTTSYKLEKGYTLITFEQFKKYVMENKEIIAYKLKKDLPGEKAGAIIKRNGLNWASNNWDFTPKEIEETEWFEPIYKEEEKEFQLDSDDGVFDVTVKKDGVYYGSEKYDIQDLKETINLKSISTARSYRIILINITSVTIGCKKNIPIGQIKEIVNYHTKTFK